LPDSKRVGRSHKLVTYWFFIHKQQESQKGHKRAETVRQIRRHHTQLANAAIRAQKKFVKASDRYEEGYIPERQLKRAAEEYAKRLQALWDYELRGTVAKTDSERQSVKGESQPTSSQT